LVPILTGVAILTILLLAGRLSFAREWFAVGHVVGNSLRMREEVGYAVLMTRWLALEGRRVETAEELWRLSIFAAERLGLSETRIRLADAVREWHNGENRPGGYHFARFDFHELGVIEIEAEVCPFCQNGSGPKLCRQQSDENAPCIGSKRMFDVVAELLAEGWHKGAKHLAEDSGQLKFVEKPQKPLEAAAG
jgi:hypothetical protein